MLTIGLLYLALAAGGPLPITAQPNEPKFKGGAPDDLFIHDKADPAAKARKYLDDMARCDASRDHKRAAAALALPYGSAEQGQAARALLELEDSCWTPTISSMTIGYDPQAVAAGLAEFFLANPKALQDAKSRYPASFVWPAQNKIEEFGDCVVGQGEGPVKAFIDSTVGSDAEHSAAAALVPQLAQCVNEGQQIAVVPSAMRNILAVALYRRVAVPPPAVVPAAAAQTDH